MSVGWPVFDIFKIFITNSQCVNGNFSKFTLRVSGYLYPILIQQMYYSFCLLWLTESVNIAR